MPRLHQQTNRIMQFRDLKTQYNVLKDEMDKAILDVVASSAYVMGPKIK